jgi:hypothetical protein
VGRALEVQSPEAGIRLVVLAWAFDGPRGRAYAEGHRVFTARPAFRPKGFEPPSSGCPFGL